MLARSLIARGQHAVLDNAGGQAFSVRLNLIAGARRDAKVAARYRVPLDGQLLDAAQRFLGENRSSKSLPTSCTTGWSGPLRTGWASTVPAVAPSV
jgi:hypothetical protein